MTQYREPYVEVQVPQDTPINPHFDYAGLDVVEDAVPNFRNYYGELTVPQDATPNFRMYYIELQSLVLFEPSPWYDADTEGSDMSTAIFPELKGLMFDIKRRPMFSNKIQDHVSGKETRLAFWEQPKWEFELSYDYLPNRPKSVGDTDLETILGFFLQRKGNFQTFLFRFQDDYKVTNQVLGVGTGTQAEYTYVRTFGGFTGPVDFVNNTDAPAELFWDYASTPYGPIPAGPYTVNTHSSIVEVYSVVIDGGPLTRITTGLPAFGEYLVDLTTGVFTFNSARAGKTVYISDRRAVTGMSSYELPNQVVFTEAPPSYVTVVANFEYYFNVRFLESEAEFNLFMENLYELQEVTLRSVPV